MINREFDVSSEHVPGNELVPSLIDGLQPAFRHRMTGESHLAQDESGAPTQDYSFHGLPEEWIVERDQHGLPQALHPDVVPGYWRDARFIALAQLTNLPLDG
ncbi:MAG: hypothetical protein HKN42_05105 [Granulosicoccus sp.]|nr:hypothetical protein [Granulosicoccus sp.]